MEVMKGREALVQQAVELAPKQVAAGRPPEYTTGQRKAQLSARQLSLSRANSKRYGVHIPGGGEVPRVRGSGA